MMAEPPAFPVGRLFFPPSGQSSFLFSPPSPTLVASLLALGRGLVTGVGRPVVGEEEAASIVPWDPARGAPTTAASPASFGIQLASATRPHLSAGVDQVLPVYPQPMRPLHLNHEGIKCVGQSCLRQLLQ